MIDNYGKREAFLIMLKSMTGYGRCERLIEGRKILVEIRSVNQRFTDYTIKLPKHLGALEEYVRAFAAENILHSQQKRL